MGDMVKELFVDSIKYAVDKDSFKKRTIILLVEQVANRLKKVDEAITDDKYDEMAEKIRAMESIIAEARKDSKIWRTYIWLDWDKKVIFFIAKNKNQQQMDKIISDYWIETENIIMMDWWPSSQFSYFKNNWIWYPWEQFYWEWEVPHYFMIYND